MKKVVLHIYALVIILSIIGAGCYVLIDLSRLKASNYTLYRPVAQRIADRINSGALPHDESLRKVLKISLELDGHPRLVYEKPRVSSAFAGISGGTYQFRFDSGNPEDSIIIRMGLIDTGRLLSPLRLLFALVTTAMLCTGLLLAFLPFPGKGKQRTVHINRGFDKEQGPGECLDDESGLMAAEHLPLRLESEIRRAASFDQDLALGILEFTDPANQYDLKHFAQDIRSFFIFRDLCYALSQRQVCVLLPNTELDEGIRSLKDFRKIVHKSAPQLRINGGISARTGRLLEPDVLLREADTALTKSLGDSTNPIYGFRADPEKYRALVAEA